MATPTSSTPVTAAEMSTPEALRIRHATLAEVLALINTVIADRHVPIDDEAYMIRRVVEVEWERVQG